MTVRRRIPRCICTATAVLVAVLLGVTGLLAQEDLDVLRRAAEQGDARAQLELGRPCAVRPRTQLSQWRRCPQGSLAGALTLPRFPGHLVKIHCRSRISGCGSCWQRGALSKRRWKSGVDFHGRVSFHS